VQSEERARRIRVTKGSRAVLRGTLQLGADGDVLLSTIVGKPWKLADKRLAQRAGAMLKPGEVVDVKLSLNWKLINDTVRVPRWRVEMLGVPRVASVVEREAEENGPSIN
jgi:hypothetical protein